MRVGGLLSAALCRLLIVVTSCCRKGTLGAQVSIVEIHWLSCSTARGIFLDQGSNSTSPALVGRFLATGPPRMPWALHLNETSELT